MIIISLIRRNATKRLYLSTTREYFLSILQIFESTDAVVNYVVAETDLLTFKSKDLYLPDGVGFSKWKRHHEMS